ncbi:hypothetical protein [Bradyrhizobium japonicum]
MSSVLDLAPTVAAALDFVERQVAIRCIARGGAISDAQSVVGIFAAPDAAAFFFSLMSAEALAKADVGESA